MALDNVGYHKSHELHARRRWWAGLSALERATGVLLDRIDARFHRPEGITLWPVQTFCEAA